MMELKIRRYEGECDRAQVEDLERRCEVGPAESVLVFTDTMGDPMCRIRNSPMYNMLVAEKEKELVGVIQGSIKVVGVGGDNWAKVGYVLGLRVVPHVRRQGIGSALVVKLEEWFKSQDVELAYMATHKHNKPSVRLFVHKFGYTKFRTPSILVNPLQHSPLPISPDIHISLLSIDHAHSLYRTFMASSSDFFPHDIHSLLTNNLTLGTWLARFTNSNSHNWAMLSVWNTGDIFKLRLPKPPLSCLICTKTWDFIHNILPPCFTIPRMPDFFNFNNLPFGFYFLYGLYHQGPFSGKLVRALCDFVHNMALAAAANHKDDENENSYCNNKIIVTEVGGKEEEELKHHIPHWKLLSCPEDLWCIKPFKITNTFHELTKTPPTRPLFVDPREV